MSTSSEQLWYMWSNSGVTGGNGFKIRAVSAGLRNDRGSVDTQSEQIQDLLRYANYKLPQDVIDPYDVRPEQMPVTLALVQAGQRLTLVHKIYTGLDGVRRPGAFFTHMVTHLPAILLPSRRSLPFTAREAIDLWQSPFWKSSEQSLDPADTKLQLVYYPHDVTPGPLSQYALTHIPEEQLRFVLGAFLKLQPGQHLYIAAPAQNTATLFWAIAHSFPRTLDIMRDLTFSTYEHTLDSTKLPYVLPTLVGTTWLSGKGELPLQAYQDGGVNGIALNCYTERMTTLTFSDLEAEFLQFVVNCLLGKTINGRTYSKAELDTLVNGAEEQHVRTIQEYLTTFSIDQKDISQETLISLLEKYIVQIKRLTQIRVLEEEPSSGILIQDGRLRLLHVERLQAKNVQRSLLQCIAQDSQWWATYVRERVQTVQQTLLPLLDRAPALLSYDDAKKQALRLHVLTPLSMLAGRAAPHLQEALRSNDDFHTNLWGDVFFCTAQVTDEPLLWTDFIKMFSSLDLSTQAVTSWWNAYSEKVIKELRNLALTQTDGDLYQALDQLMQTLSTKVYTALTQGNKQESERWNGMLTRVAPPEQEPLISLDLLQQLLNTPYHVLYSWWWTSSGHLAAETARRRLANQSQDRLAMLVRQLIDVLQARLSNTILNNESETMYFLGTVLNALVPAHAAPLQWLPILITVSTSPYTSTAQNWWQQYGKAVATRLQTLRDQPQPQKHLAPDVLTQLEALVMSISSPAGNLHQAIQQNNSETLTFWNEVFSTLAPARSRPLLWLRLLQDTLYPSLFTPGFQQWWKTTGRTAAVSIRAAAENNSHLAPADPALVAASQALTQRLSNTLTNDYFLLIARETLTAGSPSFTKDTQVFFLFDLLEALTPSQQATTLWEQVLQHLNAVLRQPVTQLYSFVLRQRLLTVLAGLTPLPDLMLVSPWLDLSWANFLALQEKVPLPPVWLDEALSRLMLVVPVDTDNARTIVSTLSNMPTFEERLQQALVAPTTSASALALFVYLTQHNYLNKLPLMGKLLIASRQDIKMAEAVLRSVELDELEERTFLQEQCREFIASCELPPRLQEMIEAYLTNFDSASLEQEQTVQFLETLYKRTKKQATFLPDWQKSLKGWLDLSKLSRERKEGKINNKQYAKEVSSAIRNLVKLSPTNTRHLQNMLLPYLVEAIDDTMDLTRMIDGLGEKLMDQMMQQMGIATDLSLIQRMLPDVRTRYHREQELSLLISYIQFILKESDKITERSMRQSFIDDCFERLLGNLNQRTQQDLDAASRFWPPIIVEEWESYRQGQHDEIALNNFRKELASKNISSILEHYEQFHKTLYAILNPDEQQLILHARQLRDAFQQPDDAFYERFQIFSATHDSQRKFLYPADWVNRYEQIKSNNKIKEQKELKERQERLARQQAASTYTQKSQSTSATQPAPTHTGGQASSTFGNPPVTPPASTGQPPRTPSTLLWEGPLLIEVVNGGKVVETMNKGVYDTMLQLMDAYVKYSIMEVDKKLNDNNLAQLQRRQFTVHRTNLANFVTNQQYEQITLDELVADIFVRRGIDETIKKASYIAHQLQSTYEQRVPTMMRQLQAYESATSILKMLTPHQLQYIFRIFVRHEFYLEKMYTLYGTIHKSVEEDIVRQRADAEKKGTVRVYEEVIQLPKPQKQGNFFSLFNH